MSIYRILIIICFITMIMSGRVRKGDIWVDYANAGSMT